jgi:glycosyltransferase involved in cell wall biosynthesis
MMLDFTVAICTYNGEKRLPAVLDRLLSQVNTETFSWEILVIDNNSTDGTKPLVEEYQKTWDKPFKLRYCFESRQGLAYARRCAIKESHSELIGFLDDDNLPAADWVEQAYQFGQEHPKAGAFGGQIHGQFESEPPSGFRRIARYYAILEGNKTYCYNKRYENTRQKMFPPGAGIVIRKEAWLKSVPTEQQIVGVSGSSVLTKCEDVEMLSYLLYDGWELWFNKDMHMDHIIPQSRLTKDYIMRFFKGVGLSRYQTRMIAYQKWQRPIVAPLYFANDLRKLITFYWQNKNVLETDIVTAGEMQLLKSVLVSPFQKSKK